MPSRHWYTASTNHFQLTDSVSWKWKTQPDWVIKPVTHDLVWRIRFWRIKSPEHDCKYLYWTISKILPTNLFTCKGTYMTDWVGRSSENRRSSFELWTLRQYSKMSTQVWLAVLSEGMVTERPKKKEKNNLNCTPITTSRADFAVIGFQLCSTITGILVPENFLI